MSKELFEELQPLLAEHWQEVAHFKDIPLDPDYAAYQAAENAGTFRLFTVRDLERQPTLLLGYAAFFVRPNIHYRGSTQAVQDVIYIHPAARGKTGYHFINWCDQQLKNEGVQAVYQHVKEAHNFGPMLERLGYELVDRIYARRLDKE